MGMPIHVEVVDGDEADIEAVFELFTAVDARYSTYKPDSEVSRYNDGLPLSECSDEFKHILELCEETKQATQGFFDVWHDGKLDPSGLVKGWAIQQAAEMLHDRGIDNFYLEAGGDIQVSGQNTKHQPWSVGVRNPFQTDQLVKVLAVTTEGVATSGTYLRGQHIYNPHQPDAKLETVASLTVIGPNVYEADRFATAAFAMGREGINFIESLAGFEGYMIDAQQTATLTTHFERYLA